MPGASDNFRAEAISIVSALERYREEALGNRAPVINLVPMDELIGKLDLAGIVDVAGLNGTRLNEFVQTYLEYSTRLLSPSSLAHQVSVPPASGALAELISAFINNPMAIYEMGPSAASVEVFIINWMLDKAGWIPSSTMPSEIGKKSHGGGVLTHGGSLANLTALIAARTKCVPNVWEEGNPGNLAVLAPATSHYSISRAAGILGIGKAGIHELEVDRHGVVLSDNLERIYKRVIDDGRTPIALTANACSTALGLYDPLEEIGEFCHSKNLWFHVDGAHGASALISKKHKTLLRGLEYADSMLWDAHKMLRVPSLCAALLVRDHTTLDNAFKQEASYLFHEKEQPGVDLLYKTVECTKAALGLRAFFVLGTLGEEGLSDYVDSRFQLAKDAYAFIENQNDFTCPVEPQANIICFRYRGLNEEHIVIRDKLISKGRFHLSTAMIGGVWHLRVVFMHPDTSLREVKSLLAEIRGMGL